MNISITFRQMDATDAVKGYATEKIAKLQKFLRQPLHGQVTLSCQKTLHMAEVDMHAGAEHYHAHESSEDMYASIDKVIDKLERQIREATAPTRRRVRSARRIVFCRTSRRRTDRVAHRSSPPSSPPSPQHASHRPTLAGARRHQARERPRRHFDKDKAIASPRVDLRRARRCHIPRRSSAFSSSASNFNPRASARGSPSRTERFRSSRSRSRRFSSSPTASTSRRSTTRRCPSSSASSDPKRATGEHLKTLARVSRLLREQGVPRAPRRRA